MAITYFNWYEIHKAARKDPAAIIILTHGLTKDYNDPINKLPLDQKNLLKKVYEVNQNLILVLVISFAVRWLERKLGSDESNSN